MTASKDVPTGVDDIIDDMIETPIDLASVDKPQLLFYLASRTPLSITDFAEDCTDRASKTKSILRDRFEAEINIDMTDSIRLSGDARRAVIKGSKPFIRSGQKLLKQGRSYTDEDNNTEAANCFKKAVSIFQAVSERFDAVDHKSTDLNQLTTSVKNRHDSAAKEVAKDSINYHVLRATQYESNGDERVERDPSDAREEYQRAEEELTQAVEITKEYNQSRLDAGNPTLSIDPLTERLSAISEKLQSIEHTSPDSADENSGDRQGFPPDEKTSLDSSDDSQRESEAKTNEPSETQLLEELERLTANMDKVPSSGDMQSRGKYDNHQYYSTFGTWKDAVEQADVDFRQALITDLRSVADQLEKRPTTTEIDEYGVYDASRYQNYFGTWEDALEAADIRRVSDEELIEELQRLDEHLEKLPTSAEMRDHGQYSVQKYLSRFDSWDEALGAAGINKRERLIEELQRLADELNQVPTTTQMNETGTYSSTYVSNEFGSWDASLTAAGIDQDTEGDTGPEQGGNDPTDHPEIDASAFENSWQTIPDNSRLDGQFLAQIKSINIPRGDRKSHVISLIDRTGKDIQLDIWKTHNLDIEWREGGWYVMSEVRGSVWTNSSGEIQKRLSSTKDFDIDSLGSDFDPDQICAGNTSITVEPKESTVTTASTDSTTSTSGRSETEDEDSTSTGTDKAVNEEDIFGDIMSDFDDL